MKPNKAFLTVVLGLTLSQVFSANALSQRQTEEEIIEVVFRYQLRDESSNQNWKVFYLALGLIDPGAPSDKVMQRFDGHEPIVKKFVKSDYDAEQIRKEKALVVGVGEVKLKTDTEAGVEGFRFIIPGEAQGFRCALKLEEEKWVVKSCKGTWIALNIPASEPPRTN